LQKAQTLVFGLRRMGLAMVHYSKIR